MAIPEYLNSSYKYSPINVSVVADIITQVRADVVTNGSPQWSEPTTATFKSPVDVGGRFFQVALSQPGTNTSVLQAVVTDQSAGVLYTGTVNIEASTLTTRCWVLSGQNHFEINVLRNTTSEHEFICAGMLDVTPLAKADVSQYCYAWASRTGGGTLTNNGVHFYAISGEAGASRLVMHGYCGASGLPALTSLGGKPLFRPVYLVGKAAETSPNLGRLYQTVITQDTTLNNAGSQVEIPIDTASTGRFIVSTAPAYNNHVRLVRIG